MSPSKRDRSYPGDPHAQHPSEPPDSMAPRLTDWWYLKTMSVRHNHHQAAHHRLSPPPPSPLRTTPHSGPSIIPAESLSASPSLPLHYCQMEAGLADHPVEPQHAPEDSSLVWLDQKAARLWPQGSRSLSSR